MKLVKILVAMMLVLFVVACGPKGVPIDKAAEVSPASTIESSAMNTAETSEVKKVVNTAPIPDGEKVLELDIALLEFPAAEMYDLTPGRYRVQFTADKQIEFLVHNELRYQQWKESGTHNFPKVWNREGSVCCTETGSYVFDVNLGEGGKYYFVFDGSAISDPANLPTSANIVVTRVAVWR